MKLKRFLSIAIVAAWVIALGLPLAAGNNEEAKIKDYSLTDRKDIPVEFKWKVEDIFATIDDWKKEKNRIAGLLPQVDEKAKNWTSTPQNMVDFFDMLTELQISMGKLSVYASLQSDADLANPEFQQLKGEVQALYVQMGTKLSFLQPDILALGSEKFTQYVQQEPRLKPYEFPVQRILRTKDHVLPADQQKIVSYAGLFTSVTGKTAGILNDVDMPAPEVTLANGEKTILNQANYYRYRADKNPENRSIVMRTFWKNHKQFENTFAALFDGAMKQHLFNVKIRNYSDCLEASLFEENIDPAVYHKLIESVRANLEPLHRYIKIKQELLGLEKFKYEDIYASSVKSVDKVYSMAEAKDIITKMMTILGKEYSDPLREALDKGWIDWFPNKNKQTGAYSNGIYGVHPFIKMNYDGNYSELSTLAHELGHAMHSYFSNKTQHFANSDYSSFLAEIASTFNENILMDYLLKYEKDDMLKLYILDAYMQQVKGTIYRQTQFAEFELAMHRYVEQGNTLTPQWLNNKYLELARYYYGHDKGVCQVDDYIQNEWAGIPHFFLNYYVFNYSTGMIASSALSEMVLKGKNPEREKYLTFLKAGASKYTLDTLKTAGVDITTDKPYQSAFTFFNQLVSEMEKIVQRLKKQGKL